LAEKSDRELFITFHNEQFGTTPDAVRALDTMAERLSKGISAAPGAPSTAFQTTFESSEGIGAKALWSESLRQLSAVGGTRLFHVRVRGSADVREDRASAEAVARQIASLLR
jgi:hypothetical protein